VLRVRPATSSDADALARTVAEGFESYRAFAPDDWRPPDHLELAIGIAVRLRADDQLTWVAEDEDGEIAGQVAYVPAARSRHPVHDPTLAHLGQLFVRRAHWGTGLAVQLLSLVVADATRRDYAAMRLFTPAGHARARRFYEREGWSARGEPMLEQPLGLELIEYRRPLPATLDHPQKRARPLS
jgi:GNAT superfamily N-acetyltransferase